MPPPSVLDTFVSPTSPIDLPDGVPVPDALRALKATLGASPDPALVTSVDDRTGFRITFANDAFCRMTGYDRREVVGQSPRMFRGARSNPLVGRELVRTILSGQVFAGEDVNYDRHGHEYTVRWCVVPVRDAGGRPVRYVSYQRHFATGPDAETPESNSLLELVLRSPDVGVCVTDEGRRFVRANAAYGRIYGYAEGELVGREFTALLPPEARAEAARLHDRFLAGESARGPDAEVVRRDGSVRHVRAAAGRLVLPDGRRFRVSTVVDVTGQTTTEATLAEREARLRALYRTAPVGILLATPDDRIASANATLAEMLRCPPKGLARYSTTDLIHPDDAEDERRQVSALLNGYVARAYLRKRVRRPDGTDFWADQVSALVRHPDGSPHYLMHVLTDRTPLEDAAREAEATLRRVTDAVPAVVYRYTAGPAGGGRFTFLSRGAGRLFEKPLTAMLGDPYELRGMLEPAADVGTQVDLPDPLAAGSAWQSTHRVRLRSGRVRWVQEYAVAEPTAADGSVTWTGAFTDVTRLKEAEEQVREHLLLLQAVADNLPGGAVFRWECGPAGDRFVYLSAGAERVLGVPREELAADPQAVARALDPADRAGYAAAFAAAVADLAPVQFDGRLRGANGDVRWVRWRAHPHAAADGRVVCDGLLTDVTDQVRADRQRAATADLLRSLIDAFPGLINVKDRRSRYLLMNRYQADLYGTTPDDAVGKTAADLLGPEYGAYTAGRDQETMVRFEPVAYEETYPDARGRPHTWLTTKIPWFPPHAADARPGGVINVSTDLGPLKRAEAERLALERQLAEAERHASVAVLAAGVAHDFNNLMTVVLGHAELAAEAAADNPIVVDDLRSIAVAVRRASELCRQLLAFAGKRAQPPQPIDLAEAAREMVGLMRAVVPRAIDLRVDAAGGLPATVADPGHVRQVVLNLVTNAAQAIGSRPGRVVVRVSEMWAGADWMAAAQVCDAAPGPFLALQVADTGPGIPAELLGRIFAPYASTKGDGRGLGLAAVRGVCRAVRGAVRIDSVAGQGTTFTVLFPPSRQPAVSLSGSIPPPVARRPASGAVLVADPHAGVRTVAAAALLGAGFEVSTVPDFAAAVRVLTSDATRFRAAVMDVGQLADEAALDELLAACPGLTVVAAGGHGADDALAVYEPLPNVVYLSKPFRPDQLVSAVVRSAGDTPRG